MPLIFCVGLPPQRFVSVSLNLTTQSSQFLAFFGVSQQPYYLALLGHHFQSLKLFIPIMRQHLRHFQQNLNLKSILVQETSDNVTTTPDLESLFSIVRRIDFILKTKKTYKIIIHFLQFIGI